LPSGGRSTNHYRELSNDESDRAQLNLHGLAGPRSCVGTRPDGLLVVARSTSTVLIGVGAVGQTECARAGTGAGQHRNPPSALHPSARRSVVHSASGSTKACGHLTARTSRSRLTLTTPWDRTPSAQQRGGSGGSFLRRRCEPALHIALEHVGEHRHEGERNRGRRQSGSGIAFSKKYACATPQEERQERLTLLRLDPAPSFRPRARARGLVPRPRRDR
jgi:hypothetical protein